MSATVSPESKEQTAFRTHCISWLQNNLPPESPVALPQTAMEVVQEDQLRYLQAWQKSAYDAGLVGCDYPPEYGGGGLEGCQKIANDVMRQFKTPYFPNVIGLGMAAPTLLFHGSDALKAELLPRLFSGEEIWCQGFSEPGAGSDLAGIQTFAARKGSKWIIRGHKLWTSLAHFATWMILLARTDRSDKYGGLTFFVVPIRSALGKGVTVSPLIKASGGAGFNEVLFEDLEVDDGYRLDGIGKGWQVAMTTLAHERGAGEMVTPSSGGQGEQDYSAIAGVSDVIALCRNTPRNNRMASEDPVIRNRLMQYLLRDVAMSQAMRLSGVKGLIDNPARIQMQGKLVVTELMQEVAELAMDIEGPASTFFNGNSAAPEAGRWPLTYINSFANTIAAGSSEIQRNILGERILGLPKSK